MYNYIKNPKTNQIIKITSKRGKNIIKKYLDFLIGGGNEEKRFMTAPEEQPWIQPEEQPERFMTAPEEQPWMQPKLNYQTYYERVFAEAENYNKRKELEKTNPELAKEKEIEEKKRSALPPTEIQIAYHKAIMDEVHQTMKKDEWDDFETRKKGIKKIRDILVPGNNFESTDIDYYALAKIEDPWEEIKGIYPIERDIKYHLPVVRDDPIYKARGARPPNIKEQNQNIQEFIFFINSLIKKGNLCNIYILLGGECHTSTHAGRNEEDETDCISARFVPPFDVDANTHILSIGPDTQPENYINYRRILGEELFSKLKFFNMYWWDDNIKLLSKLEEFLEFNCNRGGKTIMINFAKYAVLESFEFPNTIEKFYGTTIDNLRKYNSLELYDIITKKRALYFSWIGYRTYGGVHPTPTSNAGFPEKTPYYIFPFWDAFDKDCTHVGLRPTINLSKISYLESSMYPSSVVERDIYFTSGFKWN